MSDVISAISTPQGRGGIAVIRMSGAGALEIAKKMFSRQGEYLPNYMYAGKIDCGAFSDYGYLVYFRAPHSFTGEDVTEFHCHGGTEIARGVLQATIRNGARQAERGEFTRRAFLNGKLSLSAAEGVGEMIEAESGAQARAAYSLITETLTKEGKRLQALVKNCLASVDADVDYPEEDLTTQSRREIIANLTPAVDGLAALKARYRTGRKIKAGVQVALCGAPNAGKSSLLNALMGYDRAIVSPVAGTTRDSVEGTIEIHGVLFHLTDTAGLRESDDEIEREGVRRAKSAMNAADLIVYLKSEGDKIELPDVPVITLSGKCDVLPLLPGCEFQVSSVTGEGLERLKEELYKRGFGAEQEGVYLMQERHYAAVSEAYEALLRAKKAAEEGAYAELYAEDLKAAYGALGTLSGETATEEIISEIFSKFCVGK